MDHAVRIMGLLQQISEDPNRDDEVIRAAVSFVGDVVNVYGVTAREGVDVEYVSNLVSDALMSNDKETKKQGKWAMAVRSLSLVCEWSLVASPTILTVFSFSISSTRISFSLPHHPQIIKKILN